jgi:hypothetical protein
MLNIIPQYIKKTSKPTPKNEILGTVCYRNFYPEALLRLKESIYLVYTIERASAEVHLTSIFFTSFAARRTPPALRPLTR